MGRADEHEIYRQLFKLDDELNPNDDPSASATTGWCRSIGTSWRSTPIDEKGQPLGTKNPDDVLRFAGAVADQLRRGDRGRGHLRESAKRAWQEGGRLWQEYGKREMPSTDDFMIRLDRREQWQAEAAQAARRARRA